MESLQNYTQTSSISGAQDPSFSPFVAKVLKFKGGRSFGYNTVCYNSKFNMIIVCPLGHSIQFYDATTFKLYENRPLLNLEGSVATIAFQPENDTYILGTDKGFIYMYNVLQGKLRKWKNLKNIVFKITFLNARFFAFSLFNEKKLSVGSLKNHDVVSYDLNNNEPPVSFHHFAKRNLLFSGMNNGSVRMYWTNRLPHLKMFSAIQAHQAGKWVFNIQCLTINGKEYVVTTSTDWILRVWHLLKGKMRLLRVFPAKGRSYSLVYLENYKMIVVAYEAEYIQFFRFPSMKLEKTVDLKTGGIHFVFVMKEKNMVGVTNQKGEIDFIQLHPKEFQFIAEREEA